MSNEEKKSLKIVVGEAVQLPSNWWLVAMTLEGNCLNDVELVEVSDGAKIEECASNRNMQFYVDFETDTFDDHKVNYRINISNQPSINKTIELKQKQQVVTIMPEETVEEEKILSALKKTKASKVLASLTEEIAGGNSQLPKKIPRSHHSCTSRQMGPWYWWCSVCYCYCG